MLMLVIFEVIWLAFLETAILSKGSEKLAMDKALLIYKLDQIKLAGDATYKVDELKL